MKKYIKIIILVCVLFVFYIVFSIISMEENKQAVNVAVKEAKDEMSSKVESKNAAKLPSVINGESEKSLKECISNPSVVLVSSNTCYSKILENEYTFKCIDKNIIMFSGIIKDKDIIPLGSKLGEFVSINGIKIECNENLS